MKYTRRTAVIEAECWNAGDEPHACMYTLSVASDGSPVYAINNSKGRPQRVADGDMVGVGPDGHAFTMSATDFAMEFEPHEVDVRELAESLTALEDRVQVVEKRLPRQARKKATRKTRRRKKA